MRVLSFAVALVLSSSIAIAADAPPASAPPAMKTSRVRGTVESFDGTTIVIKPDTGADMTAAVTPKTRYAYVEKRTFEQLKPTDFVGITAVPGRNGHLRAEEIHVLPVVGMGEGQYPWDHHPAGSHATAMSSMTNGTVTTPGAGTLAAGSMTNGSVTTSSGHELTISFHGSQLVDGKCEGLADPKKPVCVGTSIVDVPDDTPIVAVVVGTKDDVKPGLALIAFVATDDAGHNFLGSATVEKNGVKPPM